MLKIKSFRAILESVDISDQARDTLRRELKTTARATLILTAIVCYGLGAAAVIFAREVTGLIAKLPPP